MKTNILKKIGEMSEDRGVTHPLQQGQNLDRRRDFFENQIYGYWIHMILRLMENGNVYSGDHGLSKSSSKFVVPENKVGNHLHLLF